MLKGLDPILSPDLLHTLMAMGHGHQLAIVDANYPCDAAAHIIRLDGVSATRILDAVLSVMPLEQVNPGVAYRMIVDGDPGKELPIFQEFREVIAGREDPPLPLAPIDPKEFLDRANRAFVIILSGDRRLFGNILLTKGVVPPPT